jgi:hypothetical protein
MHILAVSFLQLLLLSLLLFPNPAKKDSLYTAYMISHECQFFRDMCGLMGVKLMMRLRN